MTANKVKYIAESICYALFVPLHILNTWGFGPVKFFHIPVFIMGVIGFWNILKYYHEHRIVRWLIWFIICSALPVCVSGLTTTANYATFVLLIVSVLPLIDLNKQLLLKLTPSLMLISMFLVKQFAVYDPSNMLMRFHGLYNDSNYMIMSTMVGTFLSIIAFKNSGIINRILIIGVLIMGLNFLLLSQSRGGLFAVIFMLTLGLLELYKTQKRISILLICFLFICSGSYIAANSDRIEAFSKRLDGMGQETSTQTRIHQAEEAWNGAKKHPEMIAFGIGIGKTKEVRLRYNQRPDNVLALVYHQTHIIHVTPVSVWFEHGTLAFLCYIILNIIILIKLIKERNLFVIGFFVAMTFQSYTINTMLYLPYWIAIALCANATTLFAVNQARTIHKNQKYENSALRLGINKS